MGKRPGVGPVLAPAAAVGFVVAVLAGIIVAARNTGGEAAPPPPGPMAMPAEPAFATFTVERIAGATLAVSGPGGALELAVPPGVRVWLLRAATPGDAAPGLNVAVIGVPNEVRNATVRAIVIGAPGAAAGAVAGPFAGHEAFGGEGALPLVGGTVLEAGDGQLVLSTAAGEAVVWVVDGAPLFAAREGRIEDVRPGDRIAVLRASDGSLDPAQGLLVVPGD